MREVTFDDSLQSKSKLNLTWAVNLTVSQTDWSSITGQPPTRSWERYCISLQSRVRHP
jgi:hypothetical protein